MRLRGGIAVVCSIAFVACGRVEDEEKQVRPDSELLAQADTCSESTYDWAPTATDAQKVCAGPWQQQCCSMGSTTPVTCNHAHSVGLYHYSELQNWVSRTCGAWSFECDLAPGRPCLKLCDYWNYTFANCSADPTLSVVAQHAISNVNNVRAGCKLPSNLVTQTPTIVGVTASPGSIEGTQICAVVANNAPVGHTNAENTCDYSVGEPGTNGSGALCGWDQTKIAYGVCTDPPTTNVDGSPQSVVDTSKCPSPDTLYTGPGLALSAAKLVGKKAPVCLTGEGDAPFGRTGLGEVTATDAQAQGKFQRFADRRAQIAVGTLQSAVAKDPQLDQKLIKNEKLLFEFRGSQLNPGQQFAAEGLYTSYPTVLPACSQAPDWAPPSPTCNSALDGKLVMCDRLSDPHASPGAAMLEASTCTNAWKDVKLLTCAAKGQYVSGWVGSSTNELRNAFSELRDADAVVRRSRLQDRMSIASDWYGYLREAAEPNDQRWRDTGVVAGAIVQGAYSEQLRKLDAAADVATRDQLVLGSSAADQELIQAAFANTVSTGQPPLRSAPLLFIVANALRATSDRVNEIDFIHDLGCRFRPDCGPNLRTRVSEMHRLLAGLPDDANKLQPALLDAVDVPAWRDVFQLMSGAVGHRLFEGAVLDALDLPPATATSSPYQPDLVTNATPDQVPVYAVGAIVNPSSMKADHYKRTGRFRPGETMALETSLLQSKLTDVKAVAASAKKSLSDDQATYDASFQKLIDDQLAIVRGNNAQANANNALSIKSEQLRQLAEDLDGLRIAATVDLSRFGATGVEYGKLVTQLEQSGPGFTPHWTQTFDVPPTEARYAGGPRPANVTDLAIAAPRAQDWRWPVPLTAGSLLQINTTPKQWSATCAIAASANRFNPAIKNFLGALTGPQGYGLSYTNGEFHTQAQSGEDFTIWDAARAVAGTTSSAGGAIGAVVASSAAIGGPVGAGIGAVVGMGLTIGIGLFGSSDHDTHSDGTEYRKTAAFNAALRVPSAPFPDYPAGALLVLKMPSTKTSLADLIDVEVVQSPSTTIVATSNMDIYLAVNDLSCTPTVSVGALNVTLEVLEPRYASAVRVQQAMVAAAPTIESKTKQMLVQGRVLATDLESARSQALTSLMTACGECSGPAFAPFLQYYENWVDMQLNQAERQVEIGKVERQLRVGTMEWEALATQVAQADRESQILRLLPSWAVQNIDETRLKSDTEWLVRVVDKYLYPFMRAKYPETLQPNWGAPPSLSTDPVFGELTTGLDWTQTWGAIAGSTVKAFDAVQRKLDEADLAFNSSLLPMRIAISIPKPLDKVDPSVDRSVYALGYGTPAGYTPPYRELDSTTSAAIWGAIIASEDPDPAVAAKAPPIKITVPAELLYNPVATTGYKFDAQLNCGEVLPVIKNIGIFVANDGGPQNDVFNGQQRSLPVHSSVHMNFINGSGPEPFYGTNSAWLKFSIQPQYGLVKSATQLFVPTGGGQGLSPSGEFTIDAGYSDWLDPITPDANGILGRRTLALVLVIEVERRTSGASASWVQQCH